MPVGVCSPQGLHERLLWYFSATAGNDMDNKKGYVHGMGN